MENVNCKSDRAIVTVAGVIEEMMMLKLTNLLQSLHQDLFYKRIELEISSPGGSTVALDHCIEIMERLRQQGVIFTTRALMSTSSAAALLVSLGDVRQTTRTTTFLYHKTRVTHADAVTARKATEILERTHQLDERYLNLLVQRAKNREREYGQDLPVTDFDDTDWPVIHHLLVNAGNVRYRNVREDHDKTLQELREYMNECLVEDSKLNQLYQTLFDLDRPISAALAIELRLVDGFVDNDGLRTDTGEDGLYVPEWTSLYPPAGQVGRNVLCRHTLILGETGSGKTASGILPVVSSIMRNDNHSVGCALIIDPKREIGSHMEGMLRDDDVEVHEIDLKQTRRPIINLMLRKQQLMEQALEDEQYLTAAREILIKSASLSSYSPAAILGGQPRAIQHAFWEEEGSDFALTILAFVLLILHRFSDVYEIFEFKANKVLAAKLLELGKKAGLLLPDPEWESIKQDIRKDEILKYTDSSRIWCSSLEEFEDSYASIDGSHYPSDELEEHWEEGIGPYYVSADGGMYDEHADSGVENGGSLEERLKPSLEACAKAAKWFIERVKNSDVYRNDKRFAKRFDALGITEMTDPDVTPDDKYWDVTDGFPDVLDTKDAIPSAQFKPGRTYFRLAGPIQETKRRCSALQKAVEFINSVGYDTVGKVRNAPNIMALAGYAMKTLFELGSNDSMSAKLIVEELKDTMRHGDAPDIFRKIEQVWAPLQVGSSKQMAGTAAMTRMCFNEYSYDTVAHTLYFGVEPYYFSSVKNDHDEVIELNFDRVVNEETKRSVFVFQPDLKNNETLVARSLKAAWFEAILYCDKREKDGASMPLAAYIADEFHRFITIDKEHGEQSFLDTCRSFGAFCVGS